MATGLVVADLVESQAELWIQALEIFVTSKCDIFSIPSEDLEGGGVPGSVNMEVFDILSMMVMIETVMVMVLMVMCGKFLKRRDYQTTLSISWETCMQDKKQQLEPCMKQLTGSKFGKEDRKAAYCHPV